MSSELVELVFDEERGETPGGARVFVDGGKKIWIPASLIDDVEVTDSSVTVWVPDWWAEKEGLV
jgi:hypothetical protein